MTKEKRWRRKVEGRATQHNIKNGIDGKHDITEYTPEVNSVKETVEVQDSKIKKLVTELDETCTAQKDLRNTNLDLDKSKKPTKPTSEERE